MRNAHETRTSDTAREHQQTTVEDLALDEQKDAMTLATAHGTGSLPAAIMRRASRQQCGLCHTRNQSLSERRLQVCVQIHVVTLNTTGRRPADRVR